MILRVAERHVDALSHYIHTQCEAHVKLARSQLAAMDKMVVAVGGRSDSAAAVSANPLGDTLFRLEEACVHDVKLALANLMQYTTVDVTFALQEPHRFVRPFTEYIRKRMMFAYIEG